MRRALLILTDGVRADCVAAAPTLSSMLLHATFSLHVPGACPPTSEASWPAVLGADSWGTVFGRLARANVTSSLMLSTWPRLRAIAADATSILSHVNDDEAAGATERLILHTKTPLLAVHLDEVDAAGHADGFGPHKPAYMAAIGALDEQVRQLMAATVATGDDWLVAIASDHGGGEAGEHCDNSAHHADAFFILHRANSVGRELDTATRRMVATAVEDHLIG